MIIMIDNYDSFTYNLVQYFGDLGVNITVFRNDKITIDEIFEQNPKGFVISPGPGTPNDSGICLDLVKFAEKNKIPLLGVCLGHQAIGQAFGGNIIRTKPMHGKTSQINHCNDNIFKDIPSPLTVTRYHSLIVEKETFPDSLATSAHTEDGIIMGLYHKTAPIFGVQFHPESIATAHGHRLLKNFTEYL